MSKADYWKRFSDAEKSSDEEPAGYSRGIVPLDEENESQDEERTTEFPVGVSSGPGEVTDAGSLPVSPESSEISDEDEDEIEPEGPLIDPANYAPDDTEEQPGRPNDAELRDAYLTQVAQRASATMNDMAETLRQQALQAFEVRRDPLALSVITMYFGPMTKFMAKAVERQPEWFEYEDDLPKIDATADDLVILFELQKLSLDKYARVYLWWQRENPDTKPWVIREMVAALMRRRGRTSKAQKVYEARVERKDGHLQIQADLLPSDLDPQAVYDVMFSRKESEEEILGRRYAAKENKAADSGKRDESGEVQS